MTPTTPHPDFLPGFDSEPEVATYLERCAKLVLESVAFGTHILQWRLVAAGSTKNDSDGTAKTIIVTHLRWCLELAGGLAEKFRSGWIDSAAADLRSLFESSLSLEYMLTADSVRRAFAYQCCFYNRRIRFLETQLSTTKLGRQFAAMKAKDRLLRDIATTSREPQVSAEIQQLKSLLTSVPFQVAEGEFQRLRRERNRVPEWFSFHGGPRGLEELANHLSLGGFYEVFYRDWSETAHALRVFDGLIVTSRPGFLGLKQLHLPHRAPHMMTMTINLLSSIYAASVSDLENEHRLAYGGWRTEIAPEFAELRRIEFHDP